MERGSPQIDRKVLPYFLDADHFSIILKISEVCSLYPGLRVFGFDNAKWNWVLLTPLGQDRKKGQPVGTEQWCTFNGRGFAMGGIKICIA